MRSRRQSTWITGIGILSIALVQGCAGQITFAGASALTVAGDPPPPPPPPPPPKKEEPPPPPARVEVRDNKIEIREKIQFDHAKATIKPESHDLLNEIVDVLKKNPHIKKVSIEGHASSDGDAAFNKKLSGERATSVMKYLVEKGIGADALQSKGFGSEKPIATNDTEDGREKNRRVEFNIIEQDITKKKVEIDPTTGKEKVLETTKETAATPVPEEEKPVEKKPGLARPKPQEKK